MSDENASHPAPPPGERAYWLDQPQNVNLLVKLLVAACVIVVLADFGYHKHGHFGFQEWFAFDAVFGFVAYVGLVNTAKLFRKLVIRDEDYYERDAGSEEGSIDTDGAGGARGSVGTEPAEAAEARGRREGRGDGR